MILRNWPAIAVLGLCVAHSVLGQSTRLSIDRASGPARVLITGETNRLYSIDGSDDLLQWDFLLNLTLTNQNQPWVDALSTQVPKRFYRAAKLAPSSAELGVDFRLIDDFDRSQSLQYWQAATNIRAFVLIFTGNGCAKMREMAPAIRSLTNRFSAQGVVFWLIDSNDADSRSNILAEATALGLGSGPRILCDSAQIVARAYGATTTPEVVALNRTNRNVFYRGAIDDRVGSNALSTTQFYLSNALNAYLTGAPITPSRTQPTGCNIAYRTQLSVTYADDVAPILRDNCVRCHSAGNIAPFAFASYEDVAVRAPLIRSALQRGIMPPWHADPNYSQFTNDFSLPPSLTAKIVQWIDEGAMRGAGIDLLASYTPPVDYPSQWPAGLGPPDYILTVPTQNIPATGVLDYRYLTNVYAGPTTWLRAAVVLPGNRSVVHHVLVSDGDDNFLNSFFVGYVPGTEALPFPAGTGKPVTTGQKFVSQIHYVTVGMATSDVTRIGFYFSPATTNAPLIQSSAASVVFSIPAGAQDYQITAQSSAFSRDVYLYDLSPHMHLRGSRFMYEAIYPAGHTPAREVLLSVPKYDFAWQTPYRFAQPKRLPAGTVIKCTGAWDNSYLNRDNPNPAVSVGWGDQTFNEMFIGYFSYSEIP